MDLGKGSTGELHDMLDPEEWEWWQSIPEVESVVCYTLGKIVDGRGQG